MTTYYSDIVREAMESITPLEKATSDMTDGIAVRLEAVMKKQGMSKSELARRTGRRPSDVTKWLGGGHNFTCKTIALIEQAIGTRLIDVLAPHKR